VLPPISWSWRQVPWDLRSEIFFFQSNSCGHSSHVTTSLTRGWVCRLQVLLVLASLVILRSESLETNDHILLSQIRDSPHLEGQVPGFVSPPPVTGWPSYTPRHWVPFSSPPRTRRATVEVLEPSSTRADSLLTICPAYNISVRTAHKTPSFVAIYWLLSICLFRGRCLARGLNATILSLVPVAALK
jgi:hypothetical protein